MCGSVLQELQKKKKKLNITAKITKTDTDQKAYKKTRNEYIKKVNQ